MKGQLTVFFALVMTTVLSLAFTLIDGARYSALRLEISTVHQTAGYSVLSQYHRQLFERYGLLFFHAADLNSKTSGFMNDNFEKDDIGTLIGSRDLLALKAEESQQEWISLATDNDGLVLRRQCVECMEERYGITYLEQMTEWIQSVEDAGLLKEEAKFQIEGNEWCEEEIREQAEISLQSTLIPSTFSYLEQEALKFLLGQEEFSKKELTKESRLSERVLVQGDGISEELRFENNQWDQLLFVEYVLEYTGDHVTPLEDGHLKYQTEYILSGEEMDGANLWNIADRLLQVRICANTAGILSDESRSSLVGELSSSLAAALGNPETEPVIYAALVLVWAEIEGIYDVRNLLRGESVGLLKAKEDWLVDVSVIADLAKLTEEDLSDKETNDADNFELGEMCAENVPLMGMYEKLPGQKQESAQDERKGEMYYEDYLRLFLWFQDGEITAIRLMDIIESDIRVVTEQETFCLDMYADRFRVKTRVTSAYGKEFWITREYGY